LSLQFVSDASHKLIRNLRIIKSRVLYPQMQDSTRDLLHVTTFVGARDKEAVTNTAQSQTSKQTITPSFQDNTSYCELP